MANAKEAKARIKINKLLEEAGWRYHDGKQYAYDPKDLKNWKFLDLN